MKYAVQFYDGSKMLQDTKPLDKEEAFNLFNECLKEVKRMVKSGSYSEPVLCIWEDVGDSEYPVYSKELATIDHRDGIQLDKYGTLFYETKVYIEELKA